VKVLVADDERNIRDSIAEFLGIEGMETRLAGDGAEAKRLLEEDVFDAAVLDLRMPGMSGIEILAWLREAGPAVPVIMISAYGEVRDAVGAMKLGARDYLVKPFDPEELAIRLRRIGEETRLLRAVRALRNDDGWVGDGAAMQRIKQLAAKVAPTNATVLITGESGTGKEVVARAIHRLSPRGDGPFVPINLGGIPENLLESELFGYEKGAFTGAERRKEGLFEIASGGTLFLDEIGELPVHLQVKLLRVIQERKIQRLGGTQNLPIDVRILAATNRNLEERVKQGEFREDLFYRLNVLRIHIPPLRERPEDIEALAGFFLARYSTGSPGPAKSFSFEAMEALKAYSFPGNVRELENLVERACILSDEAVLLPRDLGLGEAAGAGSAPSRQAAARTDAEPPVETVKDLERRAIVEALKRRNGNKSRASGDLGISRRTLHNKIKEYGLES